MSTENGYEEDDESSEPYGPSVNTDTNWMPKLFEASYRTTQLIFAKKNGKMVTCLRQPRDLYALSRSAAQANPRWPIEYQFLTLRPLHILYTPTHAEPLQKRGKEIYPPHKSSNISGKVVYDNSPDPEVKYFVSSKADCKLSKVQPYFTLQDENDKTLLFESRFESGNLMRAIKVGEYDYQLWLKFDTYTKKHTQWYYFQIKNARPNITYRFTIMNFLKSGSLYNEGMKPLMYSEKDARDKSVGWIRVGSNIKYYKNNIKVEENKERCYYSLHWTCTFPNENDIHYFAHSYPYTYSDLQEYLTYLGSDSQRRKVCKQRVLCQTLAGNHVYVLTITAPTKCPKQAKSKKAIVITARIHPGETIASWLMKGMLDYLTSDEPDAKILRETFIFKVVPMLNPDGVIVGNYRCSLSGRDLNRNYKTVLKDSFPPVWSTRYLIKRLQEEREVLMYCDFHGHSKKKNIFIYGCEKKHENIKCFSTRVFPLMLSKNIPDKFSFNDCRFRVQKSKEGTGRVVMWNMGIKYSYTMEASFCGSSLAANKEYHFGVQDYEDMGYHFCDTLLDFFDPDTTKFNNLLAEIEKHMRNIMMKKMLEKGEIDVDDIDFEQLDYISDFETESGGSDSSVSDGLPMQILHASMPEISKKKRLKTRKERNKARKQQQRRKRVTSSKDTKSEPVASSSQEISTTKPEKKRNQSTNMRGRGKLLYSTTKNTANSPVKCVTPSRVGNRNEYLDSLLYTYAQAGLIDGPLTDSSSSFPFGSGSSSCERCNPSYFLSFDASDSEPSKFNNENYSLFEIRMPSRRTNVNRTLELARRITSYNYRTGKAAPRISKKFSVWTNENLRRNQLLERQTLNQGDNVDYLRKRLANINCNEPNSGLSKLSYNSVEKDSLGAESKVLTTLSTTSINFSLQRDVSPHQNTRAFSPPGIQSLKIPDRKRYLPKLKKKSDLLVVGSPTSELTLQKRSSGSALLRHKFASQAEIFVSNVSNNPNVNTAPNNNSSTCSPYKVTDRASKSNTLKDSLISLGGSGILTHSDIDLKVEGDNTSAKEVTSSPIVSKQVIDDPSRTRVSTPQYLFTEDGHVNIQMQKEETVL